MVNSNKLLIVAVVGLFYLTVSAWGKLAVPGIKARLPALKANIQVLGCLSSPVIAP